MTYASPWFGVLYIIGFAGALTVLLGRRRLATRIAVALGGAAIIIAALTAGLAVRGLRYDVSGEALLLPSASLATLPRKAGPPTGSDGELSVDTLGLAGVARGVVPVLEMKRAQSVQVDGWGYDAADKTPCAGIAAVIDGDVIPGTYGERRADVAALFGEDHLYSGFQIFIPGRRLAPGTHRLSIRCFGDTGRSYAGRTDYSLKVKP